MSETYVNKANKKHRNCADYESTAVYIANMHEIV
jgi:hypothetical protein